MKRKIFFRHLSTIIALLFLSPTLFPQEHLRKQFVLEGKIDGRDIGLVHLDYTNSAKLFITDSCYLVHLLYFSTFVKQI